MSHRDRERDRGGDRERERRRERERDSGREPPREREPPRSSRADNLNDFFVPGDGIHREVMQREICKYLGPEALSRPGAYNGKGGYIVTAVRPFTPKMIENLQALSEDYVSENQANRTKGYQDIPYKESQTSRRREADSTPDPYTPDTRYVQQPPYVAGSTQPGYPSTDGGYLQGPKYPPAQASGYQAGLGYPPQGSAYPQGSGYPPQTGYPPQGSGYPAASGYGASGYPAPAGRPGNPNDQNYTYAEQPRDNASQGYPYRQPGAYPGGTQARDPRSGTGYPYVTSPQDPPMRGAPVDERYEAYGQPTPAGRGGFAAPSRGTPTGYDPPPPQPRDGYSRDPTRDDRRRR